MRQEQWIWMKGRIVKELDGYSGCLCWIFTVMWIEKLDQEGLLYRAFSIQDQGYPPCNNILESKVVSTTTTSIISVQRSL